MIPITGQAQQIRGAEIEKSWNDLVLQIRVDVYRQGATKDSILFDWGDGHLESLGTSNSAPLSSTIIFDTYLGIHTYDSPGIYAIGFRDSFLIPNIKNIEEAGMQSIV